MTKAVLVHGNPETAAIWGPLIEALDRTDVDTLSRLGTAAARPGLVLIPTADEYTGGEERARWAAGQAGAKVAVLQDLGHWWMLEDPKAGAAALEEFWSGL